VKLLKSLGLSAVLALVLTATVGIASAFASGTAFTSESSEATYSGYSSSMILGADGRSLSCKSYLEPTGKSKGPQEKLTLIHEAVCKSFEYTNEFEMNGCKLEFEPGTEASSWDGTYEGSFGIGPAGCGPITATFFPSCHVTIGAQSGLPIKYHNVGSGTSAKVEAEVNVKNLKYTNGSGCSDAKSHENGLLTGTWLLEGRNGIGVPTGIAIAPLPHSPLFEGNEYPITFNGAQGESAPHVLTFAGSQATCSTATFADTESGATAALSLSGSFSGCTVFGFASGAIATNGCKFVNEVTEKTGTGKYSGPGSISCPSGKSIEVTNSQCAVSLPAQSIGTVNYENAVESGVYKVKSTFNVKGLTYTVTKDAFGCPMPGTGTFSNGEYRGGTTFTGKNGAGATAKIRIGG
jgi:hypothetical protein